MKNKISLVAIHVFCCLAFLALPYIFAPGSFSRLTEVNENPHERTNLLSYLLMLAFIYFNYYLLIPRLFFRGKYIGFVATVVGCFLFIVFLLISLDRQDMRPADPVPNRDRAMDLHPPGQLPPSPDRLPPGDSRKPPLGFALSHSLFLFLVGIFVSLSLRINNRWREAEREKLNAELSYLKAQINPHFLFNTLNSIYSLAIEKSDSTAEAIVRLSSLMRYVIRDANRNQVSLAKELEYISHYVALQKLRLDHTVRIDFSIDGNPDGQQIAPLVLISFIENAFKYGVNPEEKSVIQISLSVKAHNLRLYVLNQKVPVLHYEETAGGIGIENTKARLQLLYPDRHQLIISDNGSDFAVELTLTLA